MTAISTPRAGSAGASTRTDYTLLRVGLWSVAVYAGLGLLGFAVFAGFWPPPGQDLDASAISQYFLQHHTRIQIGMVLMVVGAPATTPGAQHCRKSSAGWKDRWVHCRPRSCWAD